MSSLAFGGGPLIGNKLVRFVYMDESGNNLDDRHTVVAGVVVHGDQQLRPLEIAMDAVVARYIPSEDRHSFVIHGSDILNGNGYFKGREDFDIPRRMEFLADLAAIPESLGLIILHGHVDRQRYDADPGFQMFAPKESIWLRLVLAHTACVLAVESLMRSHFPDEMVQLVVENNKETVRMLKWMDREFRIPSPHMGGRSPHLWCHSRPFAPKPSSARKTATG